MFATFTSRAMNENYNAIQPNFETSAASQPAREKTRNSRVTPRNSRVIQQSQQQQQNTYQANAQQQNSGFPSQSQQSYAMEIQTVPLPPVQSQQPSPVQIAALNDQSAVNANQISSIATAAAVQNLVSVQHNFAQAGNSTLQTQHQAMRPLPTASPIASKPYKIVQPQQCYKFPNLVHNLNAQQCKFNTNNFKVISLTMN